MGTINDMIKRLQEFSDDISSFNSVKVTVNPDRNGMVEKECPNNSCTATFYVNEDDWVNILRDEEVFCPTCRQSDLAKNFHPARHVEAIKDELAKSIGERWRNDTPISLDGIEFNSSENSRHQYKCEKCKARFGTVELAQVCPSCGDKVDIPA